MLIRPGLPIPGSTELPVGFAHPHASEEARRIAEDGMILHVQVGSGVHGTSVTGQDDRDEMGLCLEPPQFVTGLAQVPAAPAARLPWCCSSNTSGTWSPARRPGSLNCGTAPPSPSSLTAPGSTAGCTAAT